jgi:hypothetical protein
MALLLAVLLGSLALPAIAQTPARQGCQPVAASTAMPQSTAPPAAGEGEVAIGSEGSYPSRGLSATLKTPAANWRWPTC